VKSLRDRILEAKSESEVEQLLKEGAAYPNASKNTKGKWERAAKEARARLGQ